ncbi:MAG: transglutaminase-like cysteine peptidase [Pseudomonadota bacterium]
MTDTHSSHHTLMDGVMVKLVDGLVHRLMDEVMNWEIHRYTFGLTTGVMLGLLVLAGTVQAKNYTFESAEDYLTEAHNFSSWAETLTQHQQERNQLLACSAPLDHCRGRTRSFNRMLSRARDLTRDEKISLVNIYINRTKYDADHPQRIYDEQGNRIGVSRSRWSSLLEFLTSKGDCEDYATAKYFMFRELGFTAENMRVLVVYEKKLRGYHAVLALKQPDGDVWLLDSDNVIRKKRHSNYRFVYAMNEHHVWDHREDFAGPKN